MSYESPVNIYDLVNEISEKTTEERDKYIYQRIRTYVDVDKEELIKALEYDRHQYNKGYEDGLKDAVPIVMCKDCRFCEKMVNDRTWWCKNPQAFKYHHMNELTIISNHENGCLLGERKEGEQDGKTD